VKTEPQVLDALREELSASLPAEAFRRVATRFGLTRTDVAWAATDVFENITTPEVQAIWHWDMSSAGSGLNDEELNAELRHLVIRRGAAA
jgi:hypothetical protein